MTRENYIKSLILNSGHTIKSFALTIDLPYTTLLSMLSRGIGGSSMDNIIKVCNGLFITVEDLQQIENKHQPPNSFFTSEHEKLLIMKYRTNIEMKPAIDSLLEINTK